MSGRSDGRCRRLIPDAERSFIASFLSLIGFFVDPLYKIQEIPSYSWLATSFMVNG